MSPTKGSERAARRLAREVRQERRQGVAFVLKMDCDNAAFGEGAEVLDECARILRRAADRLDQGQASGSLIDANGNRVGEFTLRPR